MATSECAWRLNAGTRPKKRRGRVRVREIDCVDSIPTRAIKGTNATCAWMGRVWREEGREAGSKAARRRGSRQVRAIARLSKRGQLFGGGRNRFARPSEPSPHLYVPRWTLDEVCPPPSQDMKKSDIFAQDIRTLKNAMSGNGSDTTQNVSALATVHPSCIKEQREKETLEALFQWPSKHKKQKQLRSNLVGRH